MIPMTITSTGATSFLSKLKINSIIFKQVKCALCVVVRCFTGFCPCIKSAQLLIELQLFDYQTMSLKMFLIAIK